MVSVAVWSLILSSDPIAVVVGQYWIVFPFKLKRVSCDFEPGSIRNRMTYHTFFQVVSLEGLTNLACRYELFQLRIHTRPPKSTRKVHSTPM